MSSVGIAKTAPLYKVALVLVMEVAAVPNKVTVGESLLGSTEHLLPLEDVEIRLVMVSCSGNNSTEVGVPDHQIAVGTSLNHSLPRVHVEDLGCL
jgi:hypothetical protein